MLSRKVLDLQARWKRAHPELFVKNTSLTEFTAGLSRPMTFEMISKSFRNTNLENVQILAPGTVEEAFEGSLIKGRVSLRTSVRPWRTLTARDVSTKYFSAGFKQHPLLPKGVCTFTFRFDRTASGRLVHELHLVLTDGRVVPVTSIAFFSSMTDFEIRKHVFSCCHHDREFVMWALYASDAFINIGRELNWRLYLRRNHYVPQWFFDLNGGIEPPLLCPQMIHRDEHDLFSWEVQPLQDAIARRMACVPCFGYQLLDDNLVSEYFVIFMPPLALGPINSEKLAKLTVFGQAVFNWFITGESEIVMRAAKNHLDNAMETLEKLDPFFLEASWSKRQLEERFDCGHLTRDRVDRVRAEHLTVDDAPPSEAFEWDRDRGSPLALRPGELVEVAERGSITPLIS